MQGIENFTTNLILNVHGDRIYEGLTDLVCEWWTEMFEGSAQEIGDIFTIRFGSQIYKTMKVEELIWNKSVTWRVVDALINLPELTNNKEWVGTQIIWSISPTTNGTNLQLTHIGLTPGMQCYDLCKSGWNSFLYSFSKFVTTGTGVPFRLVDTD